jgi:hypothetical protein
MHSAATNPALVLSLAVLLPWLGTLRRPPERVATGPWGGPNMEIEVTDTGARVDYSCGRGRITQPLVLGTGGRIDVKGTYVKEHPGPQREDEDGEEGLPARYIGRVEGRTMTLTVTLPDTKEDVGTFTLTLGKVGRLHKCM